jgi:hypothetical protein
MYYYICIEAAEESWIGRHIVALVDRYFDKCGLAYDALNKLRGLPRGLARRIGGDESFGGNTFRAKMPPLEG